VDSQETAALISGGAAILVAALGIGGAIAAQLFATRRAYANSLALHERQYAQQEQDRQEQVRREDAYRFAEQRRSIFARFVRLGREYVDGVDAERAAAKNLQRTARQRDRMHPSPPELETSIEIAEQLVTDARTRSRRLAGEFGLACEEIHLLASPDVRQAADGLWNEAHRAAHSESAGYLAARAAFLEAARRELGIALDEGELRPG
jgi:hypothetical protein